MRGDRKDMQERRRGDSPRQRPMRQRRREKGGSSVH